MLNTSGAYRRARRIALPPPTDTGVGTRVCGCVGDEATALWSIAPHVIAAYHATTPDWFARQKGGASRAGDDLHLVGHAPVAITRDMM